VPGIQRLVIGWFIHQEFSQGILGFSTQKKWESLYISKMLGESNSGEASCNYFYKHLSKMILISVKKIHLGVVAGLEK